MTVSCPRGRGLGSAPRQDGHDRGGVTHRRRRDDLRVRAVQARARRGSDEWRADGRSRTRPRHAGACAQRGSRGGAPGVTAIVQPAAYPAAVAAFAAQLDVAVSRNAIGPALPTRHASTAAGCRASRSDRPRVHRRPGATCHTSRSSSRARSLRSSRPTCIPIASRASARRRRGLSAPLAERLARPFRAGARMPLGSRSGAFWVAPL